MKWIEGVRARTKIADLTEKANEQHYEVCPVSRYGDIATNELC